MILVTLLSALAFFTVIPVHAQSGIIIVTFEDTYVRYQNLAPIATVLPSL
ncbi:hypothetical protein B0H16DRAFT_1732794 [Mycena metata]|uniref:Uncharacterized protein n=1 Tax=Mycena metata TaxID=1033252 RepID=A0AAD7MVH4_9AGAR|nr:hypothetical protein B0H16DRAFT_1732794 [Mycena metata]